MEGAISLNSKNKDSSETVLSSYAYTYDQVGNKTSVLEHSGRQVRYQYDDLYRLTQEEIIDPINGDRTFEYVYDSAGNRLSRNDSIEGLTTYIYDENDRLLSETTNGQSTAYTYDLNGNVNTVISLEQQVNYTWSSENRLIGAEITDVNGTRQIEYQYDVDGTRVASVVSGDETRYLVDTNRQYAQVLEEYSSITGTSASYVYGNELISQFRDGSTSFYLYDGHSGVRQLESASGQITDTYIYEAYGEIIKENGLTKNSYLYRGEQYDENIDKQYLRARYYDMSLGRLLSEDNYQGHIFYPASRHRFLYGYNNPISNIDPSGNITLADTKSTINLSGILQAIGASAYIFQSTFSLLTAPDIKWDGEVISDLTVTPSLLGFGIPIDLGISLLEAASQEIFDGEKIDSYHGYWLLAGGGYSTNAAGIEFPVQITGLDEVKIFSDSFVGVGPHTLFGAYNRGDIETPNYSGAGFTIGFGKGYFSNQEVTGQNIDLGIFAGVSIPIARLY